MTTNDENFIEIACRLYEDGDTLKRRLQIGENALNTAMKNGMPAPLYIARRRWFDRERVDLWLLSRTSTTAGRSKNGALAGKNT